MKRTHAVHPWAAKPLETFVSEAGVRLALLMTPHGQVFAQHGFVRAVDVMAASALAAAVVSSTEEITRLLDGSGFTALSHHGAEHGVYLAAFDSPQGRLVLLVIFGKESSLGLVQLFFQQFVGELVHACPPPERKKAVLASDFERELNESLAALFRV